MQTYISMLRGINVSGHNSIKMDALWKMFEDLGFDNVRTYIQSGNVIFHGQVMENEKIEKIISAKIKEVFGFDVPVIVKTFLEIENILQNNDFVNKHNKDANSMHITFLSDHPKQADIDKIKGDFGGDEFIIADSVIYLFCPNGYGNTKLSNQFFENKLKVTTTTRNWRTINELLTIAKSISKKS